MARTLLIVVVIILLLGALPGVILVFGWLVWLVRRK